MNFDGTDTTIQNGVGTHPNSARHRDIPAAAAVYGVGWRRVPLTIVMPVLNEADRLPEALQPLWWADQVIVVDGGSTDSTVEIAREMGALVLEVPGATIAAQRNVGIAAARNGWIFALDIDERLPDSIRAEISSILRAPRHAAYKVRFRNFYLGVEMRHGSWARDWHVRLFRRELRFVERRVHEELEHVSDLGSLLASLEHSPYRDLNHHLSKMLRYAFWGAQDLHARRLRPRVRDVTVVPFWRFFREYLVFSGWRDGERGLVCAALSSCAALLKYAHLFAIEWQAGRPGSGCSGAGSEDPAP